MGASHMLKHNRNDRSWKDRSVHVCHFIHGLKEGHGDQCAARAPRKEVDPRGLGTSGRSERPLSRFDRTSDGLSECHGPGKARPCLSRRSMRFNSRHPTSVAEVQIARPPEGWSRLRPYGRGRVRGRANGSGGPGGERKGRRARSPRRLLRPCPPPTAMGPDASTAAAAPFAAVARGTCRHGRRPR
jgi:hypothetical protein